MPIQNHLIHNLVDVSNFLELDKNDLSKAANITKASVRYDEHMPAELKRLLSEVAVLCESVATYFEGDVTKTALWFKVENPGLGGITPRDLIRFGRLQKLSEFIQNQLEGDMP